MIEKTLKTTTGKLLVKLPDHLSEITLGQMIALQEKKEMTDIDAISILSGIPVANLANVKDASDLLAFSDSILLLSQQITQLYNSDALPKVITILSGKVKVISNLSIEPAGAFMAAREIIAEEISQCIKIYGEENWQNYFNPSLKACSQLLAHYFYCRVTGKPYNDYEAEAFTAEIKKLRVTEALPIAKHFFTCYPSLSKQKISFWHRLQQLWRKRQASVLSKSLSTSIR